MYERLFVKKYERKWGIDQMKVKTMIMIAAICFAIIPMIAYTAITNINVRQDGTTMFESELKNLALSQANSIQAILNNVQSDADTLARMPGVREYGESGSSADLANQNINRFMGDNPLINSVSLVDESGKIVAGSNIGSSYFNFDAYGEYKDDVLYFNDAANTSDASTTMFIKKTLDKGTLFINYNLGGDNSILARFTSASTFYSQGSIYIIDTNNNWSLGTTINSNLETQFTSDITSKIPDLEDNTATDIINYDGTNGKSAGVLIKAGGEDGLVALVACPVNRTGYYSSKSLSPITLVTVLISVAGIVAAIMVSKVATRPLNKIEETLVKIRRGDHEARIRNMANNEYGQMSRAFNNVVDEIVVSEDRYKVISDMSDNIIFEWNFKTNDVTFSNNFNKKFSYRPPSDHFGDSFLMKAKIHPDDANRYRSDLDQLEKGKSFENNEYRIKNIYGDFIWILMRTATLTDADGKPLKAVGVMVDIDRAKKSEAKLTEQASYDALTELYNRETIESQIDNEITLAEARKSEMAVLFIDVDDFKHYNDNYSHATGDQVLKFLAKTIKETVDGIGFAGRYGGDEFVAMIRNAETNSPADIAQKIIDKLAAGFDADIGERLSVSVSIGIAVIKDNYNTRVEYLIGKADDAMYSVKKSGKSNFAFI